MAKVYSKSRKEIMWEDNDGLFCLLEEAIWDIEEVLELRNPAKLNEYDEWLVKVLQQMDDLLDTLIEEKKDYSVDELLDREPLAEVE